MITHARIYLSMFTRLSRLGGDYVDELSCVRGLTVISKMVNALARFSLSNSRKLNGNIKTPVRVESR